MEKYCSTLTSKGQTTIPIQIRNYLNLDAGEEIEFEIVEEDSLDKKVVIRKISLFKNLQEVLSVVLRKAKEYSNMDEDKKKNSIVNLDSLSDIYNEDWIEKRNKFKEYLKSLDFEVVKIIQVIMYLGRDEDYDENDYPNEIYRKQKENFDEMGWNTKELEINQILSKGPSLYGYLLNGFKILKIDV